MMSFILLVVLFTAISTPGCWSANFTSDVFNDDHYSNYWVVKIDGDNELAHLIAKEHGHVNKGPVGDLKNHYFFEHQTLKSRTRRSVSEHELLSSHHLVQWAEQQKIIKRTRREFQPFHDPLYKNQWYLENTGQAACAAGLDVNVLPTWKAGYSGKGVVVAILDDGLEYTHPDLKKNYYAAGSYDFNSHDNDPIPRYSLDNINKHGTRCAGEVAAEAQNGVCGVGVAYNAKVAGIRMLDGDVTDAVEGGSLSYKKSLIDIYSSSWGPDDDGRTVDGPGRLARKAFEEGTMYGRNGRGAIFVWATGNGGKFQDYCSCDGYINSIHTISIGAVDDCGRSPWYAEPCPGTMAVTYSSGKTIGPDLRIVTTDLRKTCTLMHTGTSAAAPLAAGIFALVLEANPMITWRDLQHLIVRTSKKTSAGDMEWQKNGAGFNVNVRFGFGVLDATKLVQEATKWKTVAAQHFCESTENIVGLTIPASSTVVSEITTTGCAKESACITTLEHVHVVLTIKHAQRGRLYITLWSPAGTKSPLLRPRSRDVSRAGFDNWTFLTVFNWGENPTGKWKLSVQDSSGYAGVLVKWQLHFYGTCKEGDNAHRMNITSNQTVSVNETKICLDECKKGCPVPFSDKCIGCSKYCDCDTGECVSQCQKDYIVDYTKRHCKRAMDFSVKPTVFVDESGVGKLGKDSPVTNQNKPLISIPSSAKVAIIVCAIAILVAVILGIMYLTREMPSGGELRAKIAYCPVSTKPTPKCYVDAFPVDQKNQFDE